MTMLRPTRRMVARNRIRSDLSFRAISVYKAELRVPERCRAVSSHQSVLDEGTSFADRGSLRSQQPVPRRKNRLMTAHHSSTEVSLLPPFLQHSTGSYSTALAAWAHPRREITPMPRFGFTCPQLGMPARAPL